MKKPTLQRARLLRHYPKTPSADYGLQLPSPGILSRSLYKN
nr:MAG TPA: hypothetical protein [Caudoviricetes sp.]